MDTYLNLHNFFSFLPFSFCPLSFFFSHLSSLFTLPGTIQLFNYYFVHNFHYAGDICPPKHFCILSLISFFLTLQILFTIMDIAHCYFTFDQNFICISIFFEKVKTHFLSSLTFNNNCLKSLSSLVWQQIFPRRSYVYFLTRLHSLIYCSNVNCQ
jgi:hypothetical protein